MWGDEISEAVLVRQCVLLEFEQVMMCNGLAVKGLREESAKYRLFGVDFCCPVGIGSIPVGPIDTIKEDGKVGEEVEGQADEIVTYPHPRLALPVVKQTFK